MIERSSEFAIKNAGKLNEEYFNMSDDEIAYSGDQLIQQLTYWENRLLLEDRIMEKHIEKYRDLLDDENEKW
tara:strand:+ start:129 stop:344 length:216 start_codon:yes stop_codon:yes gene_type:complete